MYYLDLIFNLALLIALSIVSGFIDNRWNRHTRPGILLQGILFGGAAVLGMLRPLTLSPGIIVDGRSIMVSLCTLFFGPWSGAISTAMAIACRIWLGGTGMMTGTYLILGSAGVGLLAHFLLKPEIKPPSTISLYIFGLVVHTVTNLLLFTLPGNMSIKVIRSISLPVITLFPLATILIGKILSYQVDAKRATEALATSEAKLRSIFDNIGLGISVIGTKMEIIDMNRQMRKWFPDIDLNNHPVCYRSFHNPPRDEVCDNCPTFRTLREGLVHDNIIEKKHKNRIHNIRIVSSPVFGPSGEVTAATEILEDITEKLTLESQLRQAQKMDAIGRLAGGVAHDFNNMLGVIIGYTDLALIESDQSQSLSHNIQEIRKAADHSADLTRQLLAFARKQTILPSIINLNRTVEGMLTMLRRLIREGIDLTWLPGEIWPLKMDPSQIDQILVNLCVNARDAINNNGKITIETGKTVLDDAYCADNIGFAPGEFVTLTVSDNGKGMDKETSDKIFEPFYTTKAMGSGTGLGLATVYGIVKQNNGFIKVYSESGYGSTFKLYLPRHMTETDDIKTEKSVSAYARGQENILLVEDDSSMLEVGKLMLENFGYKVLAASNPNDAITMATKYKEKIDLLITDVVMPEMNGKDLEKKIKSLFPEIKCLFMSGYTGNVITHQSVLEEGVNFLQKPFSREIFASRVREILDCD